MRMMFLLWATLDQTVPSQLQTHPDTWYVLEERRHGLHREQRRLADGWRKDKGWVEGGRSNSWPGMSIDGRMASILSS